MLMVRLVRVGRWLANARDRSSSDRSICIKFCITQNDSHTARELHVSLVIIGSSQGLNPLRAGGQQICYLGIGSRVCQLLCIAVGP